VVLLGAASEEEAAEAGNPMKLDVR
jgi:hypothetical protein